MVGHSLESMLWTDSPDWYMWWNSHRKMKILGMTSSLRGDVVVVVGGSCPGGCGVGGRVG